MQRAHVTDLLSCNVYLQVNISQRNWGFFLRQTDFLPGHTQVGLHPGTSTSQKDDKIRRFILIHIESAESVDPYRSPSIEQVNPSGIFTQFVKQLTFQAHVAHLKICWDITEFALNIQTY